MPRCGEKGPGCGAEVLFVPNAASGRTMILNAQPSKGIVLWDSDAGEWGIKAEDSNDRHGPLVAQVVNIYTDHHATCPNRSDWIGRNRSNPPKQKAGPGEPASLLDADPALD